MKTFARLLLPILIAGVVSSSAFAREVISISIFRTAGHDIPLVLSKEDDGKVCQEYVSVLSRKSGKNGENDGKEISVTISAVCDSPIVVKGENGFPDSIYPAKLEAVRSVTTANGDGIQIVEIRKRDKSDE